MTSNKFDLDDDGLQVRGPVEWIYPLPDADLICYLSAFIWVHCHIPGSTWEIFEDNIAVALSRTDKTP